MTRLIVGLGNPGPEYEWTRHNVGFHVLDELASLRSGTLFRSARHLDGYRGPRKFVWAELSSPDAILVKPLTYMNLSGEVVAPIARFLASREVGGEDPWAVEEEIGTDPGRILVVYDDMDLDLGRLRLRPHGGAGGQKGMRSIIEHLSSDRFPRLRVGIGRAGTDAARHVLTPFPPDERVEAEISVKESAEAILDWLQSGDIERCMTRFHSRWNQES